MNSRAKKITIIILVALYLPLVLTLDFHHNHDTEFNSHDHESDFSCSGFIDAEHDPCPVKLITWSHAPLLECDLAPEQEIVELELFNLPQPHSFETPYPLGRSPPEKQI